MLYEVKLQAVCTVLVEADSEDEALERATDETSSGDYGFLESGPARLVPDAQRDSALRHVDRVL